MADPTPEIPLALQLQQGLDQLRTVRKLLLDCSNDVLVLIGPDTCLALGHALGHLDNARDLVKRDLVALDPSRGSLSGKPAG